MVAYRCTMTALDGTMRGKSMQLLTILLALILATSASWSSAIAKSSSTAIAKKKVAFTEKQAVAIVANRPEVKSWKKGVLAASKARGCSAHIEFDRKEKGDYIIHVYELVPDDAETSHTATFNWYHVNQSTGRVTKEF